MTGTVPALRSSDGACYRRRLRDIATDLDPSADGSDAISGCLAFRTACDTSSG